MNTKGKRKNEISALDKLIDKITVDAYGDDEELWAFRQAFEDDVTLPADGFVIGEPVSVVEIDYGGNERRGLTAKCRREDASEYEVAASDVLFPKGSSGALLLAAYRRWLGLEPYPAGSQKRTLRKRRHKAKEDDLDLSKPVELVVLSVTEFNDLKDAGDRLQAIRILMELCQSDLRCLEAHAHLGYFDFKSMPQKAIRHYEVGLRIGELSLGNDFEGVLHWGLIDNRPFLRCMHGYGLCLWRLGHFYDAERVFDRMLWLNPSDNQGVRFLIDDVRAGTAWEEREFE